MKFYYFGCIGQAGHFLWNINHTWEKSHTKTATPWGYSIDGGSCHKDINQEQGKAKLNHKDGWTSLSFWDRSVDTRPGCNSNFIAEGIFTFEEMVGFAEQYFPDVLNRFKFKVVYDFREQVV